MVDINRPWVIDNELTPHFPGCTRGNTGEVAEMVASPLQQTAIAGRKDEPLWRRAPIDFGAFDAEEFRPDAMDVMGAVPGYSHMSPSIQRVFGVRMPGAGAELMDRTYLGYGAGARHRTRHQGPGRSPRLTTASDGNPRRSVTA